MVRLVSWKNSQKRLNVENKNWTCYQNNNKIRIKLRLERMRMIMLLKNNKNNIN